MRAPCARMTLAQMSGISAGARAAGGGRRSNPGFSMNDASQTESAFSGDAQPESSLARSLRAGAFVMTAEVVPPASCNAAHLLAKALPLRGLAAAGNAADGAGARADMGATAAAAILLQNGMEPILQLACRDRNRIALAGELMGAAALGIRNLLLLRGDDPTAGDQKDAKPVFDLDSRALMEMASALRDRGTLPHGQAVSAPPPFFLAAADPPDDPAPDLDPPPPPPPPSPLPPFP